MKKVCIGISTTKTSRNKAAREYFIAEYGSYEAAVLAALKAHPRRKTFYELVMFEDGRTVANEVKLTHRR